MPPTQTILDARDLDFTREKEDQRLTILRAANLKIDPGDRLLIEGASGAGKSTLLLILARLLPVDSGFLSLKGRLADQWAPTHWRSEMGLVLQKHAPFPGTVEDNLTYAWRMKLRRNQVRPNVDRLRSELDGLGLEAVSLESDASRLSVGQTARLSLLRTLLTEPTCLLLDEPFAALDPASADRALARIEAFVQGDRAVLMVGHLHDRPKGWRVLRLHEGSLAETPS